MAGRVLIGDNGIWTSRKLANLQPAWARPEYAWLYPIAGPNSVFEYDPRAIWARAYAFARPDKSIEDVEALLAAFVDAKLLFTWEQDGKKWGYWTGSEKPGRRPRASWMKRYAERGLLDPDPPEEELRKFLSRDECAPSTPEACQLHAPDVQPHATDLIGIGIGIGIGSRLELKVDKPLSAQKGCADSPKNSVLEPNTSRAQTKHRPGRTEGLNPTDIAVALCQQNGWSGRDVISALEVAVSFKAEEMPEASLETVGEWLVKAYFDDKTQNGKFAGGPKAYFQEAKYPHSRRKPVNGSVPAANDPVAHALAQMEGD
jgi:hypothetical protein